MNTQRQGWDDATGGQSADSEQVYFYYCLLEVMWENACSMTEKSALICTIQAFYCTSEEMGKYMNVLCREKHTPVLATPWCWWELCSLGGVRQRSGSGSAGHTQTSWEPLSQMKSREFETEQPESAQIWGMIWHRESFTWAMSRESGEHSLSMLLVLSLWALEFCLSFMEVLRGRLCSRFSILLRKG